MIKDELIGRRKAKYPEQLSLSVQSMREFAVFEIHGDVFFNFLS